MHVNDNQIVTDDLCKIIHDFLLKAKSFGEVKTDEKTNYGYNFTNSFKLIYLLNGKVMYTLGNDKIQIEKSSVIYLPPEAEIMTVGKENSVQAMYINFELLNVGSRKQFIDFMKEMIPSHFICDEDSRLLMAFKAFFREGEQKLPGHCICMQGMFTQILVDMIRLNKNYSLRNLNVIKQQSPTLYVDQAIRYINEHIYENIIISDIADAIGISAVYLYKLFIKRFNKSPQQLIKEIKIGLAKDYLKNQNLSIKVISNELGFCSPNHFTTTFKKETGVSPNEYRKNNC